MTLELAALGHHQSLSFHVRIGLGGGGRWESKGCGSRCEGGEQEGVSQGRHRSAMSSEHRAQGTILPAAPCSAPRKSLVNPARQLGVCLSTRFWLVPTLSSKVGI